MASVRVRIYRVVFYDGGSLGSLVVTANTVEHAISLTASAVKIKNVVIHSVNPIFMSDEEEKDILMALRTYGGLNAS